MKSSYSLVPILLTEERLFYRDYQKASEKSQVPETIHLISTSCVPSMRQDFTSAENMKIIYSSNLLSPDIAGRTSDLADNITTRKSSQRKVKQKLSIRYGAIYTHSFVYSRYKKIHVKVQYYNLSND